MAGEIRFDGGEFDRIQALAMDARDQLVARIVEEFPREEAAEALCFALAMLAASGFVPGKAEQQYDMALALNQVLSRLPHMVPWRMTPAA